MHMPDEVLSPASSGAFAAPSADLTAVLTGPAIARLSGLGMIRAEGADATGFLQSQLTNDVTHLGNDAFQLNGYCTPKGRLLATFHQWRDGEAVMLQLPRELVAAVTKRLSMFVLRAKVRLADASDQWTTHALLGPQASEALRVAGMDAPAQTWASVENAGLRVSRLPAAPNVTERFLLTHAGSGLPAPLAALPVVSSDAWWWSEVAAGVPTVFLPTQEKFVPQMINFEVLGGVNFKKGCYPGQEIVARSQYLGKLKRRMQVAHARVEDPPAAGSDVVQSAQEQPVGTVVMAARAPGGGVDLLFEAPVDRIGTGTLHIGSAGGAELRILPLPYELFDPTA
ncbi:MAG TPA: folate-binding protein [Burkholderiaceae bacterium]|nr:folate-binding protein [Burkholderiaceae bacterium]